MQFTETYQGAAHSAVESGWPCIRFQAGHFHRRVEAEAVTGALTQVADQLLANTSAVAR